MRCTTRCSAALLLLAALVGGVLGGCGGGCCDGPVGDGAPVLQQAPAFLLQDVNDTSATAGQLLSPRAYLGRVSAWYFGQAT